MALTLGDNFSYGGSKPLDARLTYSTLADMKAVADSTMYNGCLAYCVATDKTYQWKLSNTVDPDTGRWREFTTGSSIEVDDEIDEESTNPVQNAVIAEALNTKQDAADKMTASDMDDVVTPLPSVMSRRFKYSTEEQVIGEWIDGKPLYQKTIVHNVPTCITDGTYVEDYVLLGADKDFLFIESNSFQSNIVNANIISAPFFASNSDYRIKTYFWTKDSQSSLIIANANTSYNGYKAYVTIRYTKTTD